MRSSAPSSSGHGHWKASREVLRRYGNMSSPTILFVLAAMLESGVPARLAPGLRPRPGDRKHAVRGARVIGVRERSRARS